MNMRYIFFFSSRNVSTEFVEILYFLWKFPILGKFAVEIFCFLENLLYFWKIRSGKLEVEIFYFSESILCLNFLL